MLSTVKPTNIYDTVIGNQKGEKVRKSGSKGNVNQEGYGSMKQARMFKDTIIRAYVL